MTENSNKISINPNKVIWILSGTSVLLVVASVGMQIIKYVYREPSLDRLIRLFYLDEEDNIPTAFSAFILLFAGIILTIIAYLSDRQNLKYKSKWAILSLGFIYLAYDEAFQLHESFGRPFKPLFEDGNYGVFFYPWVIPGIAIVLFLGLFFLRYLLALPSKTRFIFIISAILFIGGSIGVELFGGKYVEKHGFESLGYITFVTIEESLEMAGSILFIWGLLDYYKTHFKELVINFNKD